MDSFSMQSILKSCPSSHVQTSRNRSYKQKIIRKDRLYEALLRILGGVGEFCLGYNKHGFEIHVRVMCTANNEITVWALTTITVTMEL